MPRTGTLRIWHEDRGFGFIAPRDGGAEIFVHISAFPRDGSRPTAGERLSFEVGPGKNGKPQAVDVYRQALGRPTSYPTSAPHSAGRTSPVTAIIALLLVAGIAASGYSAYRRQATGAVPVETAGSAQSAPVPQAINAVFQCDGRTHCSQMTSCSEATFFLRNCPNTQMDGDHDGIPCEQQLCSGR